MAAEIPARRVPGVWEQGVGASLIQSTVVLDLVLVVLLLDQEIVLDLDGGVGRMAEMHDKGVPQIEGDENGEKRQGRAKDGALHAVIILAAVLRSELG